MKIILKISAAAFLIFILTFCSKRENPEARTALNNFKNYIDSIVQYNDQWKNLEQADTFIQERPVDPFDPAKITTDTFIINRITKKTVLYPPWKYGNPMYIDYAFEYKRRLKIAISFFNVMTEPMKNEFEDAKKKFEFLLPPKNILNIDSLKSPIDVMSNSPLEIMKQLPPDLQKQILNSNKAASKK